MKKVSVFGYPFEENSILMLNMHTFSWPEIRFWGIVKFHINSFQFKFISIHFNSFIESTQLIFNMY